jgi:hypothetical protein
MPREWQTEFKSSRVTHRCHRISPDNAVGSGSTSGGNFCVRGARFQPPWRLYVPYLRSMGASVIYHAYQFRRAGGPIGSTRADPSRSRVRFETESS